MTANPKSNATRAVLLTFRRRAAQRHLAHKMFRCHRNDHISPDPEPVRNECAGKNQDDASVRKKKPGMP